MKLGKVGKVRLAMAVSFAACIGLAGATLAAPYIEGEASAESIMQYRQQVSPAWQVRDVLVGERSAENSEFESAPVSPEDTSREGAPKEALALGIDWEGLRRANPDVIGWISVPGTRIDYAIVQASRQDPQHYLYHDVAHQESPYGCPYLDADAASQGGLAASFPIIYGHHLINGQMFSDFAKFANADYAREHSVIFIETPGGVVKLKALAVNVVDANQELIQTSFADENELTAYLQKRISESEVILDYSDTAIYRQVFCFVTCSYGSENERTLVYATPEDEE